MKKKALISSKYILVALVALSCSMLVFVIVDIAPQILFNNSNTTPDSGNWRSTSETCRLPPEIFFNQDINIPPTGETVVQSGELRAGQSLVYRFNANEGQRLAYEITNNLCIQIWTPDDQLLATRELPESGQYKFYVWTPSGSTTFDLKISLNNKDEEPQAISPNSTLIPDSSPIADSEPLSQPMSSGGSYLGHLAYSEANSADLMIVGSYGRDSYQRFESMDVEAGKALMDMIYTARDAGIWIIPTSGFRGFDRQQRLFQNQIEKLGSAEEAAKVSAPPGYSEHHTGFAIDLADGRLLRQEFSQSFADTAAYQWLMQNAVRFGFELSFPPNNTQGISFEPWHWRFVGSQRAATTFEKAKNLN